ncbi:MAG TPA: AMP-binding protein, partial [Bacteroidales bacterium]|nr:AMP-binding protein [Bacteroidales bacterium]
MGKKTEILANRLIKAFDAFSSNEAIFDGIQHFLYSDLSLLSSKIASSIALHKNDDRPVAILGKKSFYTYAGICGTLFASRAYMPLNMRFPLARNLKMISLSGAGIMVADSHSGQMLKMILD